MVVGRCVAYCPLHEGGDSKTRVWDLGFETGVEDGCRYGCRDPSCADIRCEI